jgi:hypothetical protein
MADERQPQDEPQDELKDTAELSEAELEAVAGGQVFDILQQATMSVIKEIGAAISTAARGG